MREHTYVGTSAGEDVRAAGERLYPQGTRQMRRRVESGVADVNTGDRSHPLGQLAKRPACLA